MSTQEITESPTNMLLRVNEKVVRLFNAAAVLGLSKKTRLWLKENDPKALQQLDNAMLMCDPEYFSKVTDCMS